MTTGRQSYKIAVEGCDATTYVSVELTAREAALVERLANVINENAIMHCEPTMSVDVGAWPEDY